MEHPQHLYTFPRSLRQHNATVIIVVEMVTEVWPTHEADL